jgi:transcription initiation factor TFIID subunit 9B
VPFCITDDYEPRVVNQLQDFMFKYVTDILLDAEAYAEHAGKSAGTVEMNDVMLAIQARTAYTFVQPPSQDMLSSVAKRVNAREIPKFPAQKAGLLIPEDKDCITTQSYHLLGDQ